ncbi:MAG TPA: HAD-IIIC family phosphatase [Sphingomicrobium sp.]|nr:HAD-IIIC family phosphatase [Sphingomicrobium sp.]
MQRQRAAALLLEKRTELSGKLAELIKDWPKYSAHYLRDPASFAEIECGALVDYMAAFLRDGDVAFRHLYVGEKAKQFHDPSVAAEVRRDREAAVLEGERDLFLKALSDDPSAQNAALQAFDVIRDALTGEAQHELRVLLIGDCLYLDVIAFLTAPALAEGIRINPTFVASHDFVEIRDALAKLAREPFDLVFLSPFTYSLLSDYEALQRTRVILHPWRAHRHAQEAVRLGEMLFDTVADLFECPVVVHVPAPVLRHEGTIRERLADFLTLPMRNRAIQSLTRSFSERAATRSENGQAIMLIDEAKIASPIGLRAAGRYYHRLALQHPARFGALVADLYCDILFVAAKLRKRKLVVCDLDETLWEGVVGEGLGVRHYHDRQKTLLSLKKRGVVLAINSKNDPSKVTWDSADGQLSMDDFVSRQINWEPKSINMRRIAEHLNLKEKDFVFVDDRPDERAMIDEIYPQMQTLDACDSRSWRRLQIWAEILPARPDADRTKFYRQRDAREAFISADAESGAAQRSAMYHKLELKLMIREAGQPDVVRITDLINRTNQFNMTAARVTRRQVFDWIGSEEARLMIADAEDRFGSMGTIAVLLLTRSHECFEIPVFVLSCRVFGYGMEFAMLEESRKLAEQGTTIFGQFCTTEHNQPCHDVYPNAGFLPAPGGWELPLRPKLQIAVPDWLTVRVQVRPYLA